MSLNPFLNQLTNKNSNFLDSYAIKAFVKFILIPLSVTFYRSEDGFGIFECENEKGERVNIKGNFLEPLIIGQSYRIEGKIVVYNGEKQIYVSIATPMKPTNKRGIIAYLKTLEGLDERAEEIYELFQDNSIDVMLTEPMKIANAIKGIGKASVEKWKAQLEKINENQDIMLELLNLGLNNKQAKMLFDEYKESVIFKIQENPYCLLNKFNGFGFKKCDDLAHRMGYDPKGMYRIQEGVKYVLQEASYEGHTFLPRKDVIERTKSLLDVRLPINTIKKLSSMTSDIVEYKYGEVIYKLKKSDLLHSLEQYKSALVQFDKEIARLAIIEILSDEIMKEVENLHNFNQLVIDEEFDAIFLLKYHMAEEMIATRIIKLSQSGNSEFENSNVLLDAYLNKKGISLELKQREAVILFNEGTGGFFVLNGSAGCGKTFTLKVILDLFRFQFKKNFARLPRIHVFAPTGRASKVASASIGMEAMTVHRGLKYNPDNGGFFYNETNPLESDVVIIDESSMLDVELAKALLLAIANGTKVIFLGDVKQLPSVGPGNVLKDIIESGAVPVVTLNVVKRQGQDSGLIENANKIIAKEMITSHPDKKDAFVVKKDTPVEIVNYILKSIDQVRKGLRYPMEDIQVLSPQRSTMVGVDALNYYIQQHVNPDREGELVIKNKTVDIVDIKTETKVTRTLNFKIGDKVIHTRNDYTKEWYSKGKFWDYQKCLGVEGITNGETGTIVDVIIEKNAFNQTLSKIVVQYDDMFVFYEDDYDDLDHAYALTIHKSQGSQWGAVIMPISMSLKNMLDNNLFYTGYTRAKKFCVVVGDRGSIEYAIRNQSLIKRYTQLGKMLKRIA